MIPRFVRWALVCITVQALFAIPYRSAALASGHTGWGVAGLAIVVAIFLLVATVRLAPTWVKVRAAIEAALAAIPTTTWLAILIVGGIAARIAWAVACPNVASGSMYFAIVKQLVATGVYRDTWGWYAFWPPGYVFFLLPFVKVFGTANWVPILSNMLLYAGSIVAVHAACARVFRDAAPRLATLLVAIWPNYFFWSATANKELMLVAVVPLAILSYIRATGASGSRWMVFSALAGASLALIGLTQPGLLLLPAAFVGYELSLRGGLKPALARLGTVAVVMALLMGSWAYRNYVVLGRPVLTTNGGSTFYRANNPVAFNVYGGYSEKGERSLDGLDELEQNRVGYQYAKEWIQAHPIDFLRLSWEKQIFFLGDDGDGAYETVRRGLGITGTPYLLAKLVSNAFWLALWCLLLAGLARDGATFGPEAAGPALLGLTVGYFWLIDAVFETGTRHHVPLICVLATLVVLGTRARRASTAAV